MLTFYNENIMKVNFGSIIQLTQNKNMSLKQKYKNSKPCRIFIHSILVFEWASVLLTWLVKQQAWITSWAEHR